MLAPRRQVRLQQGTSGGRDQAGHHGAGAAKDGGDVLLGMPAGRPLLRRRHERQGHRRQMRECGCCLFCPHCLPLLLHAQRVSRCCWVRSCLHGGTVSGQLLATGMRGRWLMGNAVCSRLAKIMPSVDSRDMQLERNAAPPPTASRAVDCRIRLSACARLGPRPELHGAWRSGGCGVGHPCTVCVATGSCCAAGLLGSCKAAWRR